MNGDHILRTQPRVEPTTLHPTPYRKGPGCSPQNLCPKTKAVGARIRAAVTVVYGSRALTTEGSGDAARGTLPHEAHEEHGHDKVGWVGQPWFVLVQAAGNEGLSATDECGGQHLHGAWGDARTSRPCHPPRPCPQPPAQSPSMLGSPSSSDRIYLLRNNVQKLKKNQSVR